MIKRSAGLLMYRRRKQSLEVFLVHPGGPIWAKRDSWSIPKGEYEEDEAPFDAALREFTEETGFTPEPPFVPLGTITLKSGKTVIAWGFQGDVDPAAMRSNTCFIEWPPRSGRQLEIPEVDRGGWFTIEAARQKIFRGQEPFLDRLLTSSQ